MDSGYTGGGREGRTGGCLVGKWEWKWRVGRWETGTYFSRHRLLYIIVTKTQQTNRFSYDYMDRRWHDGWIAYESSLRAFYDQE